MAITQTRTFDHYFAAGLSGYTPDSGGNSYDYTPQQGSIPGPVLIRRQPYQCSYGTAIVIPYYAVEGVGEIWGYWPVFHPRLTLTGATAEAGGTLAIECAVCGERFTVTEDKLVGRDAAGNEHLDFDLDALTCPKRCNADCLSTVPEGDKQ